MPSYRVKERKHCYKLYESVDEGDRTLRGSPKGVLYLDSKTGTPRFEEQPLIRLHTLPVADFSGMNLLAYQDDSYRSLPYQLSRGCTDKCSFCSEWVFWRHFRSDTTDHVIDQVDTLVGDYAANHILFTDSLLNGQPKRLQAFAERLLNEGMELSWSGFMRAQMEPETARLLKQAGCESVFVGVESFDDETLARMNKRRSELDNVRALRAFLDAGIMVTAGFIPGYPGDSRDAFMHSVSMLSGLLQDYPGSFFINNEPFIVSPGQPLYRDLEGAGLTPRAWDAENLARGGGFEDITSGIWCSVEGAGQAEERLGRLRIATAMSSGGAWTSDFSYSESESVGPDAFDFQHIEGGWFLARVKGSDARIFGLLVDQGEREEIEALEGENGGIVNLDAPETCRLLRRLVRHHLVGPSEHYETLRPARYSRNAEQADLLRLSPFVVCRPLGWRFKGPGSGGGPGL